MLGGKAGLVHVHVGAGPGGLEPLVRIVRETEIPIEQFLPTHVTRNRAVLDQAVAFGKMGGNLDMTAKGEDPSASPGTAEALALALECGVALDQLTVSSDANGSLPRFNAQGMLTGLSLARIESLWEECRRLVRHGFPLEDVLRLVTRNPAHRAGITQAKGGIEEGKDADLLLLTGSLEIDVTMAKGRVLVRGGASLVKGTFEE
jgi:beta-aspartyl-dipeptidase (metallo-type)